MNLPQVIMPARARVRRTRRAFAPGRAGLQRLEPRAVPAVFLQMYNANPAKYIIDNTVGQVWISLTDNTGMTYHTPDGICLKDSLEDIRDSGRTIASLYIKGHGAADTGDGMVLSDTDDTQSMFIMGDDISLCGNYITGLLRSITDSNTVITLTGCNTGQFGQDFSNILGNDTEVITQTAAYAVGIPGTPVVLGVYQGYKDGTLVPPDPNPEPPVFLGF
jgi:hypothetical protein